MKVIIGLLVVLVASSFAFKPIFKTNLRVTVLDELGAIADSTAVTLYRSESDYREEVNQAFPTSYTDSKGRVTFKNVEPIVYYIQAEKGDKNNVGRAVATDTLQAGQLNKLNIIIE